MGDLWTFWKTWWHVFLAAVMTAVFVHLGCEDMASSSTRPRDEIIRNYGLLIAAFWGASLAVWRSQIAGQQVEISERGLRSERFQKGADMLGSSTFSVRLGGIYALERLAQDHPEDYLDQIIKLLAAFVRHPTRDEEIGKADPEQIKTPDFRKDVLGAIRAIGNLNSNEVVEHEKPDLSRANLNNIVFTKVSLARINLTGAQLQKADLTERCFSGTSLDGANLTGAQLIAARFCDASLSFTNFTDADISGADFSGAEGLYREQFDQVCHHPDAPPKNLPPNLTYDKEAATERWKEWHGNPD